MNELDELKTRVEVLERERAFLIEQSRRTGEWWRHEMARRQDLEQAIVAATRPKAVALRYWHSVCRRLRQRFSL